MRQQGWCVIDKLLAKIFCIARAAIDALSGGQRQLVPLGQALVRKPEVLLMDESISALDLHRQIDVLEFVAVS